MEYLDNPNVQEISWKEAREIIKPIDQELCEAIDRCDPPKDCTLFKVLFRYGDIILKDGLLHLPDKNGKLCAINSNEIPSNIRSKLAYSNFPLGFVSKGGNEVFFETSEHVVSLTFFKIGTTLGIWETLDVAAMPFPRRIWEVYAGARSLFMLPKISEAGGHSKLKKIYGIRTAAPKKLTDHAHTFTDLVKSKLFKGSWSNEVIFFTNTWIDKYFNKKEETPLHFYMLKKAWQLSAYNRNRPTYDCIWQFFAKELERRQIKASVYIMDTLRHLFAIGLGGLPGFRPATDDKSSGPVRVWQDIYVNEYNLHSYVPTIMEPYCFDKNDTVKYFYYSLQAPTLLETAPKSRNSLKLIAEMRELKNLIEIFYDEALSGKFRIENTMLEWLVKNTVFDYFHSEDDIYKEIRQNKDMPKEDKALIFTQHEYKNNRVFAESSPFVRGCIRIGKMERVPDTVSEK